MLTNRLGKILYPRQQDWQRERETRTILATVLFAVVCAAIVGMVILWHNGVAK
jgi:hypothetical protein